MATTTKPTTVRTRKEYEIEEVKKGVMGGLISWWEMVKHDEMGTDIIIDCPNRPRNIYINGHILNIDSNLDKKGEGK